MTNVKTIAQRQEEMAIQYMETTEFQEVYIHELFGFDEPLKGFEDMTMIPTEAHPLTPTLDPDYVFSPSLVRRALLSMAARESIMLVGDKGTGKSSFVQQLMARLNRPLLVINAGPGVDESYLLGCKTIEDGSVKNVDGILSYAVRHGIPVLIDELCTLRPGVLVSINDILQGDNLITLKHHGIDPSIDPRSILDMDGSMSIVRHPGFRLFATDNTGGKSQKDGRFSGVNTQNSAVRSRFTSFKVTFMAPDKEVLALGRASGNQLGEDTIKSMIELGFRFRAAFEQGEAFDNLSFRELKRWANKTALYGDINEAFVDAIYTNLEAGDQLLAENLFEVVFGTEIELTEEYSTSAADMLDAFIVSSTSDAA
jgi:MoxR-like ATPase